MVSCLTKNWRAPLPWLTLLALTVALPASAQIVTFAGSDPASGPGDARPNSDAARISFDTAAGALGTIQVIDFEGLPTVSPAVMMTLAPGVTYTPTNPDSFSGIFSSNTNNLGFNTTSGGSQHLRFSSADNTNNAAVFSFAAPINSFGACFTGIDSVATSITFNDGSSHSFNLPSTSNGGVQFFGFTDINSAISSITLTGNSSDVFGVDDVRFTTPAAVPEPGSIALLVGMGVTGAGFVSRRRKR